MKEEIVNRVAIGVKVVVPEEAAGSSVRPIRKHLIKYVVVGNYWR